MGKQVAAGLKWGLSSVGRAPALQAGGREFESLSLQFGSKTLLKGIYCLSRMRVRCAERHKQECTLKISHRLKISEGRFCMETYGTPEEYHPNKPIETRDLPDENSVS